MARKIVLTIAAAALSVTVSAQQNPSATNNITKMACQSYKQSLVNMIRSATEGLSDEALRQNNQPPLTGNLKQQTTRDILQSVIESEPNRAMRQVITKASNAYIRSQSIESFERGLAELVPACVEIRTAQNRQQTNEFQQGQPAPGQGPESSDNKPNNEGQRSTLPSTNSYL
ncbi:hypothetical protein AWH63_10100 [Marinobacter sp. C18]|uniref:hypothetical protein n=1 Tax=Marinobacter sp. C18 TaxID=1772288 RepID=UPI000949199B|nr:hypothetical protein [Marinobacter sp. C18]OLF81886.1 hypothetical protein AWH63_10100 [Marinobacter sp. C18]